MVHQQLVQYTARALRLRHTTSQHSYQLSSIVHQAASWQQVVVTGLRSPLPQQDSLNQTIREWMPGRAEPHHPSADRLTPV